MNKSNLTLILFITLAIMLTSCKSAKDQLPIDSNFPLQQVAKFSFDETIERLAISDTWVAMQTADGLIGFDMNSSETLWSIPFDVWYATGSKFQIIDDYLIAASDTQVALISRDGQLTPLNIASSEGGKIWRLVAVYPNYVYIIRGPDWTLEAYDITENRLLWQITVGRGGADVFYDPARGITYITTRDYSIRAIENATGVVLWTLDKRVLHSAFDANILYLCEPTNKENVYQFSALDVVSQDIIWTTEIDGISSVYRLTSLNDLLTISTEDGIIAVEKSNGKELWHALENDGFVTAPVEFNDYIFAKGASHTIYAVSPTNGNLIGYTILESKNNLIEPAYEAEGEIHLLDGTLVLNTRESLIIYGNK